MKQLKILVLMTLFSFSNFLFSSGGGGAAARDLTEIHQLPEVKKNNLIFVAMNEYGVVTADSTDYFRIATCGARTCFIVVAYDKIKKIALMAHVADNTKLASLVEKLNEFDKKNTILLLRGGNIAAKNNEAHQKKRRNDVVRALLSTGIIRINYEPKEQAQEDGPLGASFHLNMKTNIKDEVFHTVEGFFNFSQETLDGFSKIFKRKTAALYSPSSSSSSSSSSSLDSNSTDISCIFDGRKK